MSTPHAERLLAGMKGLKDGKHEDFLIVCGRRQWKVHKIFLSMISPVLEMACYGSFKESVENRLDLSAYTEAEVDALIAYIYTGEYDESVCSPVALHVKMCIMGDYFSIPSLAMLTKNKLIKALRTASMQEVIEAAAATACAPQPTRKIQVHIIGHALRISEAKERKDTLSEIAAVNPSLNTKDAGDVLRIKKMMWPKFLRAWDLEEERDLNNHEAGAKAKAKELEAARAAGWCDSYLEYQPDDHEGRHNNFKHEWSDNYGF